jgi:hypothetical protein
LPLVLLWMVAEYGYDAQSGLIGAVFMAAIVLPWSRAVSTPERNINWTHGLGARRSAATPAAHVTLLFLAFVMLVFLPTHVLLQMLYGA